MLPEVLVFILILIPLVLLFSFSRCCVVVLVVPRVIDCGGKKEDDGPKGDEEGDEVTSVLRARDDCDPDRDLLLNSFLPSVVRVVAAVVWGCVCIAGITWDGFCPFLGRFCFCCSSCILASFLRFFLRFRKELMTF